MGHIMGKNVVTKAIGQAGSISRLARLLSTPKVSVSRQNVHQWVKQGYIPAKYALKVEVATNGYVTANEVLVSASEAEEARL